MPAIIYPRRHPELRAPIHHNPRATIRVVNSHNVARKVDAIDHELLFRHLEKRDTTKRSPNGSHSAHRSAVRRQEVKDAVQEPNAPAVVKQIASSDLPTVHQAHMLAVTDTGPTPLVAPPGSDYSQTVMIAGIAVLAALVLIVLGYATYFVLKTRRLDKVGQIGNAGARERPELTIRRPRQQQQKQQQLTTSATRGKADLTTGPLRPKSMAMKPDPSTRTARPPPRPVTMS